MEALVIQPQGGSITVAYLDDDDQEKRLQMLQELVGGCLEVVPVPSQKYLVFSATAKEGVHAINRPATALAVDAQSIQRSDYIAGVAVLVSQSALA